MQDQALAEEKSGYMMGPSIMALSSMVPVFTGDGKGVAVHDFLDMIEEVAKMGSWGDAHKVGVAKCRVAGVAYDFIWRDERAKHCTTFRELKEAILKRFDVETKSTKLQRFLSAHQNVDEDVQTYATRIQSLGVDTLRAGGESAEPPSDRAKIARELMREQLCSQFVSGLRNPVRRFVLSRRPQNFEEAVEVATQEELNENLTRTAHPVRLVSHSDDMKELRERLANLERLLEQREERPQKRPGFRGRRFSGCFSCGEQGHFARACPSRRSSGGAGDSRDAASKN